MASHFFDALFSDNSSKRIPLWLMRQAGRYQPSYRKLRAQYSFSELCRTPELVCQVTLLPVTEMSLDAAIIFSDILFPLEVFGLELLFPDMGTPRVLAEDNSSLGRIRAVLGGVQRPIHEVCRGTYAAIPSVLSALSGIPLIGFSGAPWTLLTYIIAGKTSEGGGETITVLRENRDDFERLFSTVERLVVDHLLCQVSAGCHLVQLFDSWASAVPDVEFRRYIVPSLQRITASLPCPLIYYTKRVGERLPILVGSGIRAISCDTGSDIDTVSHWAKKEGVAVQGNFDPLLLTREKDDPELNQKLAALLHSRREDRHYLFNLGHGIPKEANYDTVRHVVDVVRAF